MKYGFVTMLLIIKCLELSNGIFLENTKTVNKISELITSEHICQIRFTF